MHSNLWTATTAAPGASDPNPGSDGAKSRAPMRFYLLAGGLTSLPSAQAGAKGLPAVERHTSTHGVATGSVRGRRGSSKWVLGLDPLGSFQLQ
jgi:hypothetical protein